MTERKNQKDLVESPAILIVPPFKSKFTGLSSWELFLYPVKYKIQILLFVLAGVLFGLSLSWYKSRTSQIPAQLIAIQLQEEEILEKIADLLEEEEIDLELIMNPNDEHKLNNLETKLSSAIQKRQDLEKDLFDAINHLPDRDVLIEITGADYYFSFLDNEDEMNKIEFNSIWNTELKTKNDKAENIEIVLKLKKVSSARLKSQLKRGYADLILIDQKHFTHALEKGKYQIQQFRFESRHSSEDQSATRNVVKDVSQTKSISKTAKYLKKPDANIDIVGLHKKIIGLQAMRRQKDLQISQILTTLQRPVGNNSRIENIRIPLTMWTKLGEFSDQQKDSILTRIRRIKSVFKEITEISNRIFVLRGLSYIYHFDFKFEELLGTRLRSMSYIYQSDYRFEGLLRARYYWPFSLEIIKILQEKKRAITQKKQMLEDRKKNLETRKRELEDRKRVFSNYLTKGLWLSAVIAFILGVLTVYVRAVFVKNFNDEVIKMRKKEFIASLKFWK
jgi:hypothetical protein